jgi:hypothetical protein
MPDKEQTIGPDTSKTCKACGKPRPMSAFRRHKMAKDGHVDTCDLCRKPTPGRKPKSPRKRKPAGPATDVHLPESWGSLEPEPKTRPIDADATLSATQAAIADECDAIKSMLLAKNAEYGDSAVHPVRIFSTADPTEQIRVRIDDKISRLAAPGKKTIAEDTVADLIGYLILLRVAERKSLRKEAP